MALAIKRIAHILFIILSVLFLLAGLLGLGYWPSEAQGFVPDIPPVSSPTLFWWWDGTGFGFAANSQESRISDISVYDTSGNLSIHFFEWQEYDDVFITRYDIVDPDQIRRISANTSADWQILYANHPIEWLQISDNFNTWLEPIPREVKILYQEETLRIFSHRNPGEEDLSLSFQGEEAQSHPWQTGPSGWTVLVTREKGVFTYTTTMTHALQLGNGVLQTPQKDLVLLPHNVSIPLVIH